MLVRVISAIGFILFSHSGMTATIDQLRVGFKVLRCTGSHTCLKERITDLADGKVQTNRQTYGDPEDYELYHREESYRFADGTIIHRGDKVLGRSVFDYQLVTVTDIANGRIRTDWALGDRYRMASEYYPYHPKSDATLKGGAVVHIGDRVAWDFFGEHREGQVTDIADGFVKTSWSDGENYIRAESLVGYKPVSR